MPGSNSLKYELANLIYQYLCHEAKYSDLPEAARESLTAASECIEQAYNLNNVSQTNNYNNHSTKQQQQQQSVTNAVPSNVQAAAAGTSPANAGQQQQQQQQPTSTKHLSQLPMTTRKKLSHLRAQIKRQASKAARSRLEKRSSVAGVTTGSTATTGSDNHRHHHPLSALLGHGGCSLDAHNGTHHQGAGSHNKPAGDGYHSKDNASNNPLNSSSTESSNHQAYLNSPSTSSPLAGAGGSGAGSSGGGGAGGGGGGANGQGEGASGSDGQGLSTSSGANNHNVNSSLPSGQHQQEGSSSGGHGLHKHGSHLIPGSHHLGVSVHQKNFKQKLIALIKKFRTDGSDFDSEEQYREALERELMKAAAGRGSRAIEELLEEEIDVEGESGSEPDDWDNISETSTPKPSLRPFFSSTTLDKL